jgi:hypothetical protein
VPTDATTTQERTTLVGHVSLFPTVHHAITAVIAEMPAIGKEGRGPSDQGGYAYRGIEQITREVQPLLAKHGLVFVPKARLESWGPAPGMRDNWTDVVLSVEWTIVGPDGSTLTAQTIGIGRDSGDKGANKAMTQAFKYLLLDLFCVADAKDDSDGADYSAGHRGEPTRTTRSRPASPPRPSPRRRSSPSTRRGAYSRCGGTCVPVTAGGSDPRHLACSHRRAACRRPHSVPDALRVVAR